MSTPLPLIDVAVYGAMWAVFGLAHSLLASESMKARLHGWLVAMHFSVHCRRMIFQGRRKLCWVVSKLPAGF